MWNVAMTTPSSDISSVARLVWGFSRTRNEGMLVNTPTRNSMRKNPATGIKTMIHNHLLIFFFVVSFITEQCSSAKLQINIWNIPYFMAYFAPSDFE